MNNLSEDRFGRRYTKLEEIGAGGMGRVYKAYDTVKTEPVALKELSQRHVDSSAAILKFKNEFRIMSEFQHPNMVQVFDFGLSQDDIPFITMEFIDGENLSVLSRPSVAQVVDILIQLCQTLSVIHSRLYIHRDLKPSNIKLLADDSVKLLDYGLMSQTGILTSGKISGTSYYLAPEAIIGGVIDESTDLYSLGIMSYELLTGKRPFTGSREEVLSGHLRETPPEPITLNTDIPPSLNQIIMKLLSKDQQQRYINSAAILEALQVLSSKQTRIETAAQKQGYLYSSKLVGRATEIDLFQQHLERLKQGHSSTIFVGAAAGVGKTRLLNEMKTLVGLEGIPSIYLDTRLAGDHFYGWITELLRQLIPFSPDEETQQEGQDLAQLSAQADLSLTPSIANKILTNSMVNWFATVTQENPVVLFFDDVHWMDLKSVNILNALIRTRKKHQILIVAGFRSNEVEKTSILWHTFEEGLVEYLELATLTQQQIHALLESLFYPTPISSEFVTYCFNNCGGNVFDLLELLRYMVTEGLLTKTEGVWLEPVNIETVALPQTLEDRLLRRTDELDDTAKRLAEIAAVLKDTLDLENWQAISGYDEDQFFKAIDTLVKHQIIIRVHGDYYFGHDKISQALYQNLSLEQKQASHLQAAEFFERKLTDSRLDLVAVIAQHFVKANAHDEAIAYSLQAAKVAVQNQAEWEAFDHYRAAVHFLEETPTYPNQPALLLEIYETVAQFNSAAWIDAPTCLGWMQKAIEHYAQQQDAQKVFGLSLTYIVTSAISSNYLMARDKINELLESGQVEADSLGWAIFYGAGVCLVDWYQGYQNDCFAHAVAAIDIFERNLDTLPDDVWPAYTWALFWREKARAYSGQPIDVDNIEKIHQLLVEGKTDQTIYWHTLTAVGARAAFTGRWDELLEWKQLASQLSRDMGKIYWFECWISHSYLYGALHHGEFSQIQAHIDRVKASPDPYQVRLAYLFQGRFDLTQERYLEAAKNLEHFLEMEESDTDNSYLEGFVFLAQTYLKMDRLAESRSLIDKGIQLSIVGDYENPLYQLQFWHLKARVLILKENYAQAEQHLATGLALAQTLDSLIQVALIQKTWGMLYLQQEKFEKAESQLTSAHNIFLSLDNKYQMGKVTSLLDTLPRPKVDETPVVALDDEDTSEGLSDIHLEDKMISKLKKLAQQAQYASRDDGGQVNLEDTETEI